MNSPLSHPLLSFDFALMFYRGRVKNCHCLLGDTLAVRNIFICLERAESNMGNWWLPWLPVAFLLESVKFHTVTLHSSWRSLEPHGICRIASLKLCNAVIRCLVDCIMNILTTLRTHRCKAMYFKDFTNNSFTKHFLAVQDQIHSPHWVAWQSFTSLWTCKHASALSRCSLLSQCYSVVTDASWKFRLVFCHHDRNGGCPSEPSVVQHLSQWWQPILTSLPTFSGCNSLALATLRSFTSSQMLVQ